MDRLDAALFVGGLRVLCRISALPDTLMAFSDLCVSVLMNEFCSMLIFKRSDLLLLSKNIDQICVLCGMRVIV